VATEEPRPQEEVVPEAPLGLSKLMARLLAKHPADRPESAQVVVKALEAIHLGRAIGLPPLQQRKEPSAGPSSSRRLSGPKKVRKRRPGHPPVWLFAASAVLLGVVGFLVYWLLRQ